MKILKKIILYTIQEYRNPFYAGLPAELAFYIFMSMLPILTIAAQLLGLFSLSLDGIQEWANITFTSVGMQTIIDAMSTEEISFAGNLLLVLTALWSASKAQYSLTRATDYAANWEAPTMNYVRRRLRSYILIPMIMIVIIVALAVLVYAPQILQVIFGENILTRLIDTVWVKLRWLIVFALYFFSILLLYYMTPTKRQRFCDILPGAVFSSLGFIVVTAWYSWYASEDSSGNIIYGSLANVVVLLAWLWFIGWILAFGIILNKSFRKALEEPIDVFSIEGPVIPFLKKKYDKKHPEEK